MKPSRAVYDARNRVLARLYREHGWTMAELAAQFEMSMGNVHRLLKRQGALLTDAGKRGRWEVANRAKAADPEFRLQMSETIAAYWRLPRGSSRPVLFADEPERRAQYLTLQRKVGAVEARRLLAEHEAIQQLKVVSCIPMPAAFPVELAA